MLCPSSNSRFGPEAEVGSRRIVIARRPRVSIILPTRRGAPIKPHSVASRLNDGTRGGDGIF